MLDNIVGFVKLASKSLHPKHRHVALIFHQGVLLAWSNNSREYHAEDRAIEICKLLRYKSNLTLISIAITKEGKLKLALPCVKCQAKIVKYRISNVFYSTSSQAIIRWIS